MKDLAGRVVAITGAGSGIGRALAIRLAREGSAVALSDVSRTAVDETAALCAETGARVSVHTVDVASAGQVQAWVDQIVAEFGRVNVLINNAGVALTGDFERTSLDAIAEIVDIDFWGVVHGSKAFLPHLIASGDGHIVNVSSVFGLIGVPSQSAYNAAKFAVRGFSESLRQELQLAGHPVGVTCVHPGGVRTDIVRNSRTAGDVDRVELTAHFDRVLARTSPERAAELIIRGIRRNRARVLIGADAWLLDVMSRTLASRYQPLVVSALRRRGVRAEVGLTRAGGADGERPGAFARLLARERDRRG